MTATTSTPLEGTEEGRAFLQFRAARFGLYGSCLGWFFVVVRVVEAAAMGHFDTLVEPSLLFHVLASASLLAIWLTCRSGRRSIGFVRAAEAVGLLAACAFYAAMGLYIPVIAAPHLIVILALALGLIARAIYVPSTARRTLMLTTLAGMPMLLATYVTYRRMDVEPWRAVAPYLEEMSASGVATGTTIFAAAWWICVVLICAGASRVIYGLRKEVRDVRRLGQYTLVEKLGEGG
ncbi:MAG: hypothetical protein ACYTG6_17070, partial [Planctomycetota bacterium]